MFLYFYQAYIIKNYQLEYVLKAMGCLRDSTRRRIRTRMLTYIIYVLFTISLILSAAFIHPFWDYNGIHRGPNHHIYPYYGDFHYSSDISEKSPPTVPNIVHFIRFNQPTFTFIQAACILSVIKNHMPEQIYIHSNLHNFTGKYWNHLLENEEFNQIYKIKPLIIPKSIFGQEFIKNLTLHHASDITRLRILRQYGGIFLDNDVYIIKNLNQLRNKEISIGWDKNNQNIVNHILISHPEARFLQLWLESYRDHYLPELWNYNVGDRPFQTILVHKPSLVYNATEEFGIMNLYNELFSNYWRDWDKYSVIHLLENQRQYLDPNYNQYPVIDEENVCQLNNTLGEMLRLAYYHSNACPVNIKPLRRRLRKGALKRRRRKRILRTKARLLTQMRMHNLTLNRLTGLTRRRLVRTTTTVKPNVEIVEKKEIKQPTP